jgi:hypothetical protein
MMTTPFSRVYWENQAHTAWTNLGNPPPAQGDPNFDAFRHAFTSATWTRYFSEDVARRGGDYIELSRTNNPERDMRGDLLNNALGREIGKQTHPGWTQDTLAREIYDALGRGELVTSPLTDPRTETRNFPPDLNPIQNPSLPSNWELEGWNFFTPISPTTNTGFTSAANWQPPRDPLVLDLDANGTRTGTGWVAPDDALLVRDINGNGSIDSGRELFGDNTLLPNGQTATNGFTALQQHDTNGDGQVNSQDSIYSQLRVWRDLNQDGVSQANELQTLTQAGIASIGVASTGTNTNLANLTKGCAAGNTHKRRATTRKRGCRPLVRSRLMLESATSPRVDCVDSYEFSSKIEHLIGA